MNDNDRPILEAALREYINTRKRQLHHLTGKTEWSKRTIERIEGDIAHAQNLHERITKGLRS